MNTAIGLYDEAEFRELLPQAVLELVDVIGYEASIKLVQTFGGLDIHVPVGKLESGNLARLNETIGELAAAALMSVYGGARLYIPKCDAALIALRNQRFCQAVEAAVAMGESKKAAIQTLAIEFGITERWGYDILARMNAIQAQQRLF